MTRHARVALGFACLLVLLVVGITQSASGASNGQWIVFSAAPNGIQPSQLFRIQTNGSGLQQLTKGSANASEPSFSPKGTKIVFARLGKGIYVMNLDGTGERRLTTGSHDLYPVWSPNGKTIAFVRLYRGNYRLYFMNPDGTHKRRAKALLPSGRPSWTADSKSLYLPHGAVDKVDVRTGKEQQHLQYLNDVPPSTTVSPNSKQVAFYAPRPSLPGCGEVSCLVYAVYLANVPGTHVKRFVNDGGPAGWSPDSKSLVFAYRGGLALWPVGSRSRTALLTTGPNVAQADAPPAWQPR